MYDELFLMVFLEKFAFKIGYVISIHFEINIKESYSFSQKGEFYEHNWNI